MQAFVGYTMAQVLAMPYLHFIRMLQVRGRNAAEMNERLKTETGQSGGLNSGYSGAQLAAGEARLERQRALVMEHGG